MRLPEISTKQTQIQLVDTFGGYNHNERIKNGEFYEMKNMTTDYYPVLGNRPKRGIVTDLDNPQGMIGSDRLIYVDNDALYYDLTKLCDLDPIGEERQIVLMGAYYAVFPDKILYNSYTEEVSRMENEVTTETLPTFTLCRLNGTAYDSSTTYTGDTEPDKTIYRYWIDTSGETVVMKIWSDTSSAWTAVGTTYVKVEATGIGVGFQKDDAVELSGVDKGISAIFNDYDFNTTAILYDCGDDFLVIVGFINKRFTNSQPITVSRKTPDLDFICELNNRLWGCSSDAHEVYCCKLGDPTNWRDYRGIASDAYAATVGTPGKFTGCIAFNGSVLFFKDNGAHILYGSTPQDFRVSWKPMRGLQQGSERSMVILNERLYYKSRDAVCVFDGSEPVSISSVFGEDIYYNAIGGSFRDKYYISLQDESGNPSLFVYDTMKGIWSKEDDVRIKYFAPTTEALYLCTRYNQIQSVNKEEIYTGILLQDPSMPDTHYPGDWYPGGKLIGSEEDVVEWSVTTGDIGMDTPSEKYVKGIAIRMELDLDAEAKIEVEYDHSQDWKQVVVITATRKRSYELPFPVVRHDHMRIRISGHGEIRIHSIAIKTQEGSMKS